MMKMVNYGSVIHSDPNVSGIRMRPIDFPKPMYGLAVKPARPAATKAHERSAREDAGAKIRR